MWRWTVSRKLAALAAVGLVVAGGVGGVALLSASSIRSTAADRNQLALADQGLRQLDLQQATLQIAERDSLLAITDPDRAAALQKYTATAADISTTWASLQQLELPAEANSKIKSLNTAYAAYVDHVKSEMSVLAQINPGTQQAVTALAAEVRRAAAIEQTIAQTRAVISSEVTSATPTNDSTISRLQAPVVVALLVGLIALVAVAMRVSRLITRPLAQVSATMHALARKDLTASVSVTSRDELGEMAGACNEAISSVHEAVTVLAESANTLTAASEELGVVSTQLGQSARETSTETTAASAAAAEVAGSIDSMSAATEQMTASISEIASQATRASQVANQAVATAEETSLAVAQLDQASQEIGEIVKVITSIAEQTNLLALNATIEAARAGDAGKGFAVVASEVKDLAQETSQATDDITSKITAIQETTARASTAISEIAKVIGQISENQTTIAAAVEEQTATTAEISRSVSLVAAGSSHIASTVAALADSAEHTSTGATAALQSSGELSSLATRVQDLVHQFAR